MTSSKELTKTWINKNGKNYALLRLMLDSRPFWAYALGLKGCLVNGVEIPIPPPRLLYKRKYGSFIAPPHADADFQNNQEARYEQYWREMQE